MSQCAIPFNVQTGDSSPWAECGARPPGVADGPLDALSRPSTPARSPSEVNLIRKALESSAPLTSSAGQVAYPRVYKNSGSFPLRSFDCILRCSVPILGAAQQRLPRGTIGMPEVPTSVGADGLHEWRPFGCLDIPWVSHKDSRRDLDLRPEGAHRPARHREGIIRSVVGIDRHARRLRRRPRDGPTLSRI